MKIPINIPMKIPIKAAIATSIVLTAPFASAVTLFNEDFSADNLTTGSRLDLNDANGVFAVDNSPTSGFSIANGVLTNPGTGTETAILSVIDISAAVAGNIALIGASEITISFDISAGAGVEVFFHANGLFNGTTFGGGTDLHNFIGGGSIQSQFDGFSLNADGSDNGQGDFTGFNLLDGGVTNGSSGNALLSFTGGTGGSITVSQTVDLASFGDPDVTSVDDLQFLTFGFANNILASGIDSDITIDNFSISAVVVVPEPSSALLLVSSASLLFFRRRRI